MNVEMREPVTNTGQQYAKKAIGPHNFRVMVYYPH